MTPSRERQLASLDYAAIFLWLFIIVFGWLNIYSANIMSGDGDVFDFSTRHGKQLIWIGISLVMIVTVMLIDAKIFAFFAYPLYALIILTLIGVFLFGREINGAKSWFVIGGFQFQPSEFAKPLTALALARLLSSHGFVLKGLKRIIPALAIIFIPAALILIQPDLGSTLVYFSFAFVIYREGFSQNTMLLAVALAVLFILTLVMQMSSIIILIFAVSILLIRIIMRSNRITARVMVSGAGPFGIMYAATSTGMISLSILKISLIAFIIATLIALVFAIQARKPGFYKIIGGMIISVVFTIGVDYAVNNILKEYQKQRIYITLGMEEDPQGVGYNVTQSKIAIGSGGFSGKGYLQGTQTKLQFVPEQSTDFIFCTVGEEWGFIGTTAVILAYVLLILRLIMIAERQRSHFSRVFGYGLISVLGIHFIVNIGMTIGILPVIGIPLPFFSYGGSSFIAFTIFLFVFLKLDSKRKDLLR